METYDIPEHILTSDPTNEDAKYIAMRYVYNIIKQMCINIVYCIYECMLNIYSKHISLKDLRIYVPREYYTRYFNACAKELYNGSNDHLTKVYNKMLKVCEKFGYTFHHYDILDTVVVYVTESFLHLKIENWWGDLPEMKRNITAYFNKSVIDSFEGGILKSNDNWETSEYTFNDMVDESAYEFQK